MEKICPDQDTVPVNFRKFLVELVSGKFGEITYFGSVSSIFVSCRFDYAKLRQVVADVGDDVTAEMICAGLSTKILSINVAEFLWTRVGLSTVGMR